jgi:hypothetical protein
MSKESVGTSGEVARGESKLSPLGSGRGRVRSRSLARIIGICCVGAHVNARMGEVAMEHSSLPLVESFKLEWEDLFGSKAAIKPYQTRANGDTYQYLRAADRRVVEYLGDLKKITWPTTVTERHNWIFKKEDYAWGFLEGIYEARGRLRFKSKGGAELMIGTTTPEVAEVYKRLLLIVGVESPLLARSTRNSNGIEGVRIGNLKDLSLIVNNIHSKIPEKELDLEKLRTYKSPRKLVKSRRRSNGFWKTPEGQELMREEAKALLEEYKYVSESLLLKKRKKYLGLAARKDYAGGWLQLLKDIGAPEPTNRPRDIRSEVSIENLPYNFKGEVLDSFAEFITSNPDSKTSLTEFATKYMKGRS